MRSYLLVFNGDQTIRKTVTSRIDEMVEIVNWIAFFDNALCIVSDDDIKVLSAKIGFGLPGVQFIVTELEIGKRQGWLPKSVWQFLKNPVPAHSEAAE